MNNIFTHFKSRSDGLEGKQISRWMESVDSSDKSHFDLLVREAIDERERERESATRYNNKNINNNTSKSGTEFRCV